MLLLKPLLAVVHLHTKILILDETTDTFIEDADDFDGYDDFPDYAVEGIRVTGDGKLLIIVKPFY